MTVSPFTVDWDGQEFVEKRPGIFGATVRTDSLTATLYRYAPGSEWEEHSHPEDQMTTVLEGEIDFTVDGAPVTLRAGELAALPGGTPHSARVTRDAPVVTLNLFATGSR